MFELAGWDPIGEMSSLRTATGHLLGAWLPPGGGLSGLVTPAIYLLRTDGAIVVRVPPPCVRSDDLAIRVTGKLLILCG
jgi:hypothetical protein